MAIIGLMELHLRQEDLRLMKGGANARDLSPV
jgi:hypothetical protein